MCSAALLGSGCFLSPARVVLRRLQGVAIFQTRWGDEVTDPSGYRRWKRLRMLGLLVLGMGVVVGVSVASAASSGPMVGASPNPVAFGVVNPAGNPFTKTVTVTNAAKAGSASSSLKLSVVPGANTPSGVFSIKAGTDKCSGTSLGKGKSCTVVISYSARAGKVDSATLAVTAPKPNQVSLMVPITGTGGQASVSISPASKDFGSSDGSQLFTATNSGTLASGTYTFSSSGDSQIAVSGNTCSGASLAANGGSCTFTAAYQLTACGSSASYLKTFSLGSLASAQVTASEPACPHIQVLDATTDPASYQDSTTFDFGTTGATHTYTFKNTGGAPGLILQTTVTGGPFSLPSGDPCFSTTLDPGDTCTISVAYHQPSGCGASFTGSLRDTMVIPGIPNSSSTATANYTAHQPDCTPNVQFSPSSYDFGATNTTATFTATNTGNAASGPYTLNAPTDPGFQVGSSGTACTGASLAPGGSCTVTITNAHPTCGSTDTYQDTVSLGSLASATMTAHQVATCPQISIDPETADFQSTGGDTTFTVTNDGTNPTTLGASRLHSGAGFTIPLLGDNCSGATLAPGGTCRVTITYEPDNVPCGQKTGGSIGFTPDAMDSQAVAASFTGLGAPCPPVYELTWTPQSHTFGGSGGTEPYVLTNTGNQPVTLSGLATTTDSAFIGFSTVDVAACLDAHGTSGVPLAVGDSCSISATADPLNPACKEVELLQATIHATYFTDAAMTTTADTIATVHATASGDACP